MPQSKYLSLWKRLKYYVVHWRPVPLFARESCPGCQFTYNTDMFSSCPSCGVGNKVVWVVLTDHAIISIYRLPREARRAKNYLEREGYSNVEVQRWDVA